jgi:hypothetical protein
MGSGGAGNVCKNICADLAACASRDWFDSNTSNQERYLKHSKNALSIF